MDELKVVYSCDHVVKKTVFITKTYKISNSISSVLPLQTLKIFHVYTLNSADNSGTSYSFNIKQEFYSTIDYSFNFQNNVITWLPEKQPIDSNVYIDGLFVQNTSVDSRENPQNCERCLGYGWYTDLLNLDQNTPVVSSINKLFQEVLKYLFTVTQNDGYGCELLNLSMQSFNTIEDFTNTISEIIYNVVTEYKNIQATSTQNDISIPTDELLQDIQISQISYVEDTKQYFINLIIYNQADESINANIKL